MELIVPDAITWGSGAVSDAISVVRVDALRHDGADPLDEAAVLRLKRHGLEGSALWLAGSDGFALRHPSLEGTAAEGEPTWALELAVTPSARGRGVGASLAGAALADAPAVTAWSHGDHPAAAAIARASGLRRARELWVMRRSADVPLPSLSSPDDVTIRGYERSDESEVLRVNAAAFAHHPEQGGMDAEDLAGRMSESWWDPAGLLVASSSSGGLLGFHWTKQHDADLGEVYVVAIDPTAQGQGLGKVLTVAGLRHLHGLGVREVLLYVESDNTAAVAVYTGQGFTHADRDTHVQYRRP